MADTSTQGTAIAADAGEPAPAPSVALRLGVAARRHWQFCVLAGIAVCLRIVVILGYPPVMWFNDSFNYFQDAVNQTPDYVRPNGYPFFLTALLPLHNLYVVAVLQAGLGLGMGILSYALLRHRGLPWWGAALPALPVLFDVFEMQIEHLITADTLFTFLVTLAVVLCCWRDRPPVPVMAAAGLVIGYATLVRSVGQPLLLVFLVAMLARRAGWRRLAALAVAGVVPIVSYMIWFHGSSGKYALSEATGTFLYGRVSTFAECGTFHPSADVRVLCDPTPPWSRPPSQEYIWAENEQGAYTHRTTPLYNLVGSDNRKRFTPQIEGLTQKFATQAILGQPLDYLRVVIKDTLHTFGWNRQPDPRNIYGNGATFRFGSSVPPLPWWACGAAGSGPGCTSDNTGDKDAVTLNHQLTSYFGPSAGQPAVVRPWAGFIQWYQRWAYLPGTLLGLILLAGFAGVVARWRRWGGLGLLPLLAGALLVVLPPMTAGFSYRYVLASVPVSCLAAGLAFARQPGDADQPAAAMAAWLRRYFGRQPAGGVAVNQE